MQQTQRNQTLRAGASFKAVADARKAKARKPGKYSAKPSQVAADWRTLELEQYAIPGRHAAPDVMPYNLFDDAARGIATARRVLSVLNGGRPLDLGEKRQTVAVRSLYVLARAMGWRYERGVEAFATRLHEDDRQTFNIERARFRTEWFTAADAAHCQEAGTADPAEVSRLADMLRDELYALLAWHERIGDTHCRGSLRLWLAEG